MAAESVPDFLIMLKLVGNGKTPEVRRKPDLFSWYQSFHFLWLKVALTINHVIYWLKFSHMVSICKIVLQNRISTEIILNHFRHENQGWIEKFLSMYKFSWNNFILCNFMIIFSFTFYNVLDFCFIYFFCHIMICTYIRHVCTKSAFKNVPFVCKAREGFNITTIRLN